MSTSDDLKRIAFHLGVCVFCTVFGCIYEHFSFGVYSMSMIYSFVPSLVSALILLILTRRDIHLEKGTYAAFTLAAVTFSTGLIARGVVEIYGTENRLLNAYPTAGICLLAVSAWMGALRTGKKA